MPQRIRLQRRKGWRMPPGAIVVARPSRFGNPFRVGDRAPDGTRIDSRAQAVALFVEWINHDTNARAQLVDLRGHDLACWCPLDGPCHADVLLDLANR